MILVFFFSSQGYPKAIPYRIATGKGKYCLMIFLRRTIQLCLGSL